jgi:glycosyltransferase involved in cell wall biosynthesis
VGQTSKNAQAAMTSETAHQGGRRLLQAGDAATAGLPCVSVLTVVRNGQTTIDACIQSVAAQTYAHVEHVIVDGGSSDGTLAILRRRSGLIGYWISEPDGGIYAALNKAVRLSRADRYVVLGCDDVLLPTAVEALMRHAERGLVVRGWVFFQHPSRGAKRIRAHSAGSLIHKSAHEHFGFYDETYRIAADTKFLMRAQQAGATVFADDITGVFAAGGASGNYTHSIREHARAMQEAGVWSRLYALIWSAPRLILAGLRK